MKVTPLIINFSDPLDKCLLSIPKTLGSANLRVLESRVPEGIFFPLENTAMVPLRN